MSVSLLIVDDDSGVRNTLKDFIDLCVPEVTLVGEATNGQEAVGMAASLHPDIVLMDIRMPVMDGIEATRQICASPETSPSIITFTSYDLDELEREARLAGAVRHLRKPFNLEDLKTCLIEVGRNEPNAKAVGSES